LSDLHFDDRPGFVEAACSLLNGVECDLCVVTGDYRFYNAGPAINLTEGMRAILRSIRSRYGFYGVLGNHDRLEYVPCLEQAGLSMLVNQGARIPVGDSSLWLAGTDDPHHYRCDSIELAMRGAPDDAFVVGLIHSPEIIRDAARRGVHLYLCGHTHGGQVCLPGRIPLYANARCSYRHARGPWTWNTMLGYTTSGLGTTDLPVRFFCPPEALLFTLRHGEREFGIS
jgi:predicted MPP superfamily phosphohydrolase